MSIAGSVDAVVPDSAPGTFKTVGRLNLPSFVCPHPSPTTEADEARLFAVVSIAGKQFKVTPGDLIMVPHLKRMDIGETLRLESVLAIGGKDYTIIGRPHVERSAVMGTVQEQAQTAKLIVFKKIRRQGYRRTRGHRTDVTIVKIDAIYHDPQA